MTLDIIKEEVHLVAGVKEIETTTTIIVHIANSMGSLVTLSLVATIVLTSNFKVITLKMPLHLTTPTTTICKHMLFPLL